MLNGTVNLDIHLIFWIDNGSVACVICFHLRFLFCFTVIALHFDERITCISYWSSSGKRCFIILPGTRIALACGSGSKYFSSIDECIPLNIATMPAFLASFTNTKACNGTVVKTVDDLEALRYCATIKGRLDIQVNDGNADFGSLYDIGSISGMRWWMYMIYFVMNICTNVFWSVVQMMGIFWADSSSDHECVALFRHVVYPWKQHCIDWIICAFDDDWHDGRRCCCEWQIVWSCHHWFAILICRAVIRSFLIESNNRQQCTDGSRIAARHPR